MSVGRAAGAGWSAALRMPRVLALLWAANAGFAGLAAAFVLLPLAGELAHSALGESEFAALGFDSAVALGSAHRGELRVGLVGAALCAALYAAASVYLAGGVLDRLRDPSSRGLLGACSRLFGRMLAVGGLALVFAGLVVALPYWGLAKAVEAATKDAAGPLVPFLANAARALVVLLLASWAARVYDYARIAAVLEPERPAAWIFGRSLGFVWRHGRATLALWLLLAALAPILWLVQLEVAGRWPPHTAAGMWAQLALAQVLVLARAAAGVATLGGQMALLRSAAPRPSR